MSDEFESELGRRLKAYAAATESDIARVQPAGSAVPPTRDRRLLSTTAAAVGTLVVVALATMVANAAPGQNRADPAPSDTVGQASTPSPSALPRAAAASPAATAPAVRGTPPSAPVTVSVTPSRARTDPPDLFQFRATATGPAGALISWHIDYGDGTDETVSPDGGCVEDDALDETLAFEHDYPDLLSVVVTVTATTAATCSTSAARMVTKGTAELGIPF